MNQYGIPDIQLEAQEKATQELLEQIERSKNILDKSKIMEAKMENSDPQLMLAIGRLEGKVDTGFLAINQRLDISNGRISKSEGKIELIQQQQASTDTRFSTAAWIFGAIIAIGGLIIGAISLYISYKG